MMEKPAGGRDRSEDNVSVYVIDAARGRHIHRAFAFCLDRQPESWTNTAVTILSLFIVTAAESLVPATSPIQ